MRRRARCVLPWCLLLASSCAGAGAGERVLPTTTTTSSTTTTTTTLPPTTTTQPPPPPTTRPRPVVRVAAKPAANVRSILAFHGLGSWVDAYDFSPEYQGGGAPPVSPATVDAMAAAGVRTLYLQAAKDDPRSPSGDLLDPDLLAGFVTRAHAKGMRVVAWYLPKFADVDVDLRRLVALEKFRPSAQSFDAVGVDIEWRKDVPDPAERSARLVQLSQRLRAAAPSVPLGAIVLPPVVTEVINPEYWPGFPWAGIRPYYDVWLPMAYWTNRSDSSGYRDAFRYVDENIRRLRNDLGNQAAAVHAIGGIGDQCTTGDYESFVRALVGDHAIGGSVYDFRTTASTGWATLRRVPQ